jgi:hypothetical protein
LNNDELHNLYSSPNIVRVIKSRRLRWADMWHAWGRGEVFTGFWVGDPMVGGHWEDLDVGGRIILRWTLTGDRDRWSELDLAGSGYGPVSGFCEHGNEPLVSIKKAGYF